MSAGCYIITHRPTGRFYIGSSVLLAKRFQQHRGAIRRGTHWNENVRALGTTLADFDFATLLICAPGQQVMYENRALRAYKHVPGFLNLQLAGHAPSEPTREKLRVARTGKRRPPFGPEWRERLGAATRGIVRTPEYRARMREWLKKKIVSPQGKARILAAHVGKKRSEETRARLRAVWAGRPAASHCGKGHEFTPENTYLPPTRPKGFSGRRCRACDKIRESKRVRVWSTR